MDAQGNLEDFEWHDLPVDSLTIQTAGLKLVTTPYNDARQSYDLAVLTLGDCTELDIAIDGRLDPKDLNELEVKSLDCVHQQDGTLSGTLGILPGSAGFWTIKFTNATWSLTMSNPAMQTDRATPDR